MKHLLTAILLSISTTALAGGCESTIILYESMLDTHYKPQIELLNSVGKDDPKSEEYASTLATMTIITQESMDKYNAECVELGHYYVDVHEDVLYMMGKK